MFEEVNSQICNLANCLNDDSPVLKNWARKVIRLFSKSDDNEVSLVPKTNGHKQVAVNMYKKIIREYGHYVEATYPETPDHLSVKSLGIHTWNFQLATKVKEDGKWVAKANVDIDVIMSILEAFSNTKLNFPTVELVENEIIMYGDSNQRMSWKDKGKRKVEVHGKVVPAWNHDNMRNQAFQHFNMDELVLQSEYEDNTLIDRGVDGVFDGDIIYPVAGETPAPIVLTKNRIGVVGTSHSTSESVVNQVKEVLSQYSPKDTEIFTGGAKGVDTIAENEATSMGFKVTVFKPKTQDWNGYKERNLLIADNCTKVYSIVLPKTSEPCKHCKDVHGVSDEHTSSGGCYTGKRNGNYEVKVAN